MVTNTSNLAFGVDDITVTLSWPQQDSNVFYNVSIVPQVAFVEGLINQGSLNVTVTVDLEMSENVAYAPIHSLKK